MARPGDLGSLTPLGLGDRIRVVAAYVEQSWLLVAFDPCPWLVPTTGAPGFSDASGSPSHGADIGEAVRDTAQVLVQ
jgi:hypothetical protein